MHIGKDQPGTRNIRLIPTGRTFVYRGPHSLRRWEITDITVKLDSILLFGHPLWSLTRRIRWVVTVNLNPALPPLEELDLNLITETREAIEEAQRQLRQERREGQ